MAARPPRSVLALAAAIAITLFSADAAQAKAGGALFDNAGQSAGPGLMVKARKAVFDLSHSEIFSPVKAGELDYSSFYSLIRDSGTGTEVGVNEGPVTSAALEGVGTYIIAGPARGFSPDESAALKGFVERGGNLLVLLHISPPVASLTHEFGIIVSNFVICERTGLIGGKPQDFLVTKFAAHPVTSGLKGIAVYGTWGLLPVEGASPVAMTSGAAWADLDRDREFKEGEPVEEFAVIAVRELGAGKVVVVADDAPFQNRFINEADNRKLAENIIRWFKQR
ncbi:MAG: DUF4350 domain-containing protein [Deltaproteobacteria bacterium]|nr:DUF4350 domain-containing protein [Deltaproteobacteria bacterium]MBZ0220054.1 DUF4350 domain-containing protein [Deltaproteobacteria bacterium]